MTGAQCPSAENAFRLRTVIHTKEALPCPVAKRSSWVVVGELVEVSAWFHPFMEDADDLNQSRLDRPVVKYVHGFPHLRLWSFGARMPRMKATKARQEFLSRLGERAFRISRDRSHRCSKKDGVAAPSFGPPSFGASRKNICEIGLCRP